MPKSLKSEGPLRNVQAISVENDFQSDKKQIRIKIKELAWVIESRIKLEG